MLRTFRHSLFAVLLVAFAFTNASAAITPRLYLPLVVDNIQGCAAANAQLVPPVTIPDVTPPALLNGDFEQGARYWNEYRTERNPLIRAGNIAVVPFSGRYVARLGSTGQEISAIGQYFRVPQRKHELTFRYQIRATDATSTGVGEIQINGVTMKTFPLSGAAQVTEWQKVSLDITAYATKRIVLCAQAKLDPSSSVEWYLDSFNIP